MKMPPRDERNAAQIIRVDGRNCFVELKNDSFAIGKVHMEFAQYDTARPEGQRFTNHVHIYLDIAEFLTLAHEAQCGSLHMRMKKAKETGESKPLYESLGGTPAETLKQQGKARADGMSLSRCMKLFAGSKADYLLCAESGAGERDAKGLIVPRYGAKPEQRVSVPLSWRDFNKLTLITQAHIQAWLASRYCHHGEA